MTFQVCPVGPRLRQVSTNSIREKSFRNCQSYSIGSLERTFPQRGRRPNRIPQKRQLRRFEECQRHRHCKPQKRHGRNKVLGLFMKVMAPSMLLKVSRTSVNTQLAYSPSYCNTKALSHLISFHHPAAVTKDWAIVRSLAKALLLLIPWEIQNGEVHPDAPNRHHHEEWVSHNRNCKRILKRRWRLRHTRVRKGDAKVLA